MIARWAMIAGWVGVLACTAAAQDPPAPSGRGAAQGGRRGEPPPPQTTAPAVAAVARNPVVDAAAHDRGRVIWVSECINCHGSQARGTDTGPNVIRTRTVNFDRSGVAGSVLGPFLKAGHPTQSGKQSSAFTQDEIVALAHFLRQRVNDTMRGSPLFTVGDIVVGNRAAGEAYFNGPGNCATCHNSTTRSLAGIATRIPTPVDLQQRMLFPSGGGRGRGAGAAPNPNAVTAAITVPNGPPLTGVLVEQSDFFVTLRLADGTIRVVRRSPGMTVKLTNPLQAHVDLLDVLTDDQIHNLVAYLETLK